MAKKKLESPPSKKTKRKFVPKRKSESSISEEDDRPARKFSPKTWEEVETEGVADFYEFEKPDKKWLKKYPPPKKHATFVSRWNEFIPNVCARENFKVAHLSQLVILCDLFVEYDKLTALIRTEGMTYWSEGGRNGSQLKTRPEVIQINRTRSEIRSYCKQMGLLLVKDKDASAGSGSDDGDGDDEWE